MKQGTPWSRAIRATAEDPDTVGLIGINARKVNAAATCIAMLTVAVAGMFLGMDGWHHFRGDPAPGGKRELYEADHEAVIGWRLP